MLFIICHTFSNKEQVLTAGRLVHILATFTTRKYCNNFKDCGFIIPLKQADAGSSLICEQICMNNKHSGTMTTAGQTDYLIHSYNGDQGHSWGSPTSHTVQSEVHKLPSECLRGCKETCFITTPDRILLHIQTKYDQPYYQKQWLHVGHFFISAAEKGGT